MGDISREKESQTYHWLLKDLSSCSRGSMVPRSIGRSDFKSNFSFCRSSAIWCLAYYYAELEVYKPSYGHPTSSVITWGRGTSDMANTPPSKLHIISDSWSIMATANSVHRHARNKSRWTRSGEACQQWKWRNWWHLSPPLLLKPPHRGHHLPCIWQTFAVVAFQRRFRTTVLHSTWQRRVCPIFTKMISQLLDS